MVFLEELVSRWLVRRAFSSTAAAEGLPSGIGVSWLAATCGELAWPMSPMLTSPVVNASLLFECHPNN